jgi:hypothetical protein
MAGSTLPPELSSKSAKQEILERGFEKEMEHRLLHDMCLSLEYRSALFLWERVPRTSTHLILARTAFRSNCLFVLMSAPSIAWTRSARTPGCRSRWFDDRHCGSGTTYCSPDMLLYPCPHEMASTDGIRGGPCAMRTSRTTARMRTRARK